MKNNTEWLMGWHDRMFDKYGHPKEGTDWCRKLAYYMGEEGNDSPSNAAITIAKVWENHNPEDKDKRDGHWQRHGMCVKCGKSWPCSSVNNRLG